ncbi:S-adenosyl-L-methionine-dependent methyltransferase [Artomyces pyxidatus]|uniref:S-adenosyl-L-methionine-dependent methyltransferase n=1 Tax=Artomyces pyxidatus TaxID=48021 RepID=A0ACB8TLA5_9AGAM|nr:S-adenosyl-L-methionine-dependent methyltransferase [Artomyces pyxidatus]
MVSGPSAGAAANPKQVSIDILPRTSAPTLIGAQESTEPSTSSTHSILVMISPANNEARKSALRALVALISNAVEDSIIAYEQEGRPIPSLDDISDADADTLGSLGLHHAVRTLTGACTQLCDTLTPTPHVVFSKVLEPLETSCLRVAVEAQIPDALMGHSEGVPISKLAAKVGIEQGKLARVLRCLSVLHTFREVTPNVFANNRTSHALRTSSRLSSVVSLWGDEFPKYGYNWLYDALVDHEYGPSYSSSKSAFGYGVKKDTGRDNVGMFDWNETYPESRARFNRAMTSTRYGDVYDHYPIADLPTGATWCDVGGGVGSVLMRIAAAHPHLHLTLQDQPSVIEQAKTYWKENAGEALKRGQIAFVPINFLIRTPVARQDVYYMRHIIHDWPDADCISILKNIRTVMHPHSRVLIRERPHRNVKTSGLIDFASDDYILADPGQKGGGAPTPLLPNYGAGVKRAYLQDINMLTLLNAKERTLEEFARLGEQAGLEVVKVWDCIESGIVEMRLASNAGGVKS